jgi:hypothetical protein
MDGMFLNSFKGVAPQVLKGLGFRLGDKGTQTSRTIMSEELQHLLMAVPGTVGRESYANAVLEDNCLGKRTAATRTLSLQRLCELYALDPQVPLFRVMRDLWGINETGRPLLALLLALARDPLLRITATPVLQTPIGKEFARQTMTDALEETVGDRLNASTLDKVVRNASSSWTQSGHLQGRARKFRQQVQPSPPACAYALFIGYLLGKRGPLLFETAWAKVLDLSPAEIAEMAHDAKRLGLLEIKQSGTIVDISFPSLLTDKDRELIHGSY